MERNRSPGVGGSALDALSDACVDAQRSRKASFVRFVIARDRATGETADERFAVGILRRYVRAGPRPPLPHPASRGLRTRPRGARRAPAARRNERAGAKDRLR